MYDFVKEYSTTVDGSVKEYSTTVVGSVKEYFDDVWQICFIIYFFAHAHLFMLTCSWNNIPSWVRLPKTTNDHQLMENRKINEILSQSMTLEKILEENLKDIITISPVDQLYTQLGTIVTCNT